jgi:prepilin-type N-terminal cleavage/methylation domain-containing protein
MPTKTKASRLRDLVTSDRGFTLLETLAVMVIVGLLAAITVPQVSKWRDKAYLTSVKTDARVVGLALEHQYLETGAYPDPTTLPPGTNSVLGQPLSKGNTVVYYNSVDSVFQIIIRNSNGPNANYANYKGGQCRAQIDPQYVSC